MGGVLALAGLASSGSSGDDAERYRLKPGATGKVCLSCHVDFEQTLSRKHVHTPVAAGNCADCHDPHASEHGQLLAAEPEAICTTCHADVVPAEPRSAHDAVAAGRCVECHDPHASDAPKGLRAEGNGLCLGCHAPLGQAIAGAEHKHPPVEADCLGCHTPHASQSAPALLARQVPQLCVQCHDARQDSFRRGHGGYSVEGANCTSCHDPHGSSRKGILWANVHEPVSRKMCAQCHVAPDAAGATALKRSGPDLCRGCHSALLDETFARSEVHWPVVDRRGCANCHEPHASKETKLLTTTEGELCGGCHHDVERRLASSKVKHPPNADGACVTCHGPHSSSEPFLLAGSPVEVCGNCHDWGKHSAHPMGEKTVDPRNPNLTVDCLSCHRTHGSPFERLAHFEPQQELCVQCHSELAR
jgi:predicted CXXCH cytochrome family protein